MDVLAHRGLHTSHHDENTVTAVRSAVGVGADGVELDLRVTGDGVVVLSHDADLLRSAGVPVSVERTSWPVLRDVAAEHGLALARLTDAIPSVARCRRVVLEVKRPDPGNRLDEFAGVGRLDRAARVLAGEMSFLLTALEESQVTISSFDEDLLSRVRSDLRARTVPRFALLGRGRSVADLFDRADCAGWDEVHPRMADLLDDPTAPSAIDAAAGSRHHPDVVAWSVDSAADVRWCREAGLSAVITDQPVMARGVDTGELVAG